jgi:type III restriction enzyme
MAASFFEQPVLNNPYEPPGFHHALDDEGQPLDVPPIVGRRRSSMVTPVPKPRNRPGRERQASLALGDAAGVSDEDQEYNPTPIINEIRSHVESWRALPNPVDWGVTPTTARLLTYWRTHQFSEVRPFFCQVEAVETIVWLTEVAPRFPRYKSILAHVAAGNAASNPELFRLAMKMATGAGKTTVMAMLIAWQTANAVRAPGSDKFSKGFLIVTPGITIKDRLQVLRPEDPYNYYRTRELVPPDLLADIAKAKVVITNFHAFKRRETTDLSKVGRALLQGRGEPPQTIQTEGQMLQDACGDLLSLQNVVVINDEAHHCYRERPPREDEEALKGEEKDEAKKNNEAARLWISGIEALKRKVGVRAVYDLSATPFFLRGSGYREGSLFPWVVSDFSLMDAIECGIVKLPRVPVDDSRIGFSDMPLYRNLWEELKKRGRSMPKKGAGKAGDLDPLKLAPEIQTALFSLYSHYKQTFETWQPIIPVPPVFIVVCANTAVSKLVYEFISGFQRKNEDGEFYAVHKGHLELFRNFDEYGNRLPKPNTLLIDSEQIEADEALDPQFRELAGPEIEQFKRELAQREGAGGADREISDSQLLREVMNTVGKVGRLGEGIRCVVSVSMLTEGWDTNTVTHILGIRAFGTQLLCEQVVGRALRRQSYEQNANGLFNVEYADIMGIPFAFTSKPVVAPVAQPKPTTRIHAVKERAALEITFPRVEGYRADLPEERLQAQFTEDSRLILTEENVGPCTVLLQGIVGESVEITPAVLEEIRPSTISFHIAKRLVETRFRDAGQDLPMHLFGQAQRIVRRWLDEGYLEARGVPRAAVTYLELADQAAERIYHACQRGAGGDKRIKAILDPYNPRGSTRHVSFNTSKSVRMSDPGKSHVNAVVCDSDWEAELARVIERNPHVLSYVKNQGLNFEIPWLDGSRPRKYLPDFIVRLDDGREEPLNLVLEVKGFRGADAQLKATTMQTLWVPGVNNLGTHGRWAFEEFREPHEMQGAFDALVEKLREGGQA